jgi:hypothetical protein
MQGRDTLVEEEGNRLAEFLFLASHPLAFAANEGRHVGTIVSVLTAPFASLLFAELFAHEILSQYQTRDSRASW